MPQEMPPGFDTSILTPPAFEYDRAQGAPILGAGVSRGSTGRMQGLFFFGNSTERSIRAIAPDSGGWTNAILGLFPLVPEAFGAAEDGTFHMMGANVLRRMEDSGKACRPMIQTLTPNWDAQSPVEVLVTTLSPGATIRYTTDNTEPGETAPVVPSNGILVLERTTDLRARTFRSDLEPSNSTYARYNFRVMDASLQLIGRQPTGGYLVAAATPTPGATLRYTLDGSDPTTNSPIFEGLMFLSNGEELKVRGFRDGFIESNVSFGTGPQPDYPGSTVSTVVGSGSSGTNDGPLLTACLTSPKDVIWVPPNHLYIADTGNHKIRGADLDAGVVFTLAGSTQGFAEGTGPVARFSGPEGICFDPLSGTLLVADTGNRRIRRVTLSGVVTTLTATAREPQGIKFDSRWQRPVWSEWASLWTLNEAGAPTRFAGTGVNGANSPGGDLYFTIDPKGGFFSLGSGLMHSTTGGVVTTFVSQYMGGVIGNLDGPVGAARVYASFENGMATDALGQVYFGSLGAVRKLIHRNWVMTLAGAAVYDGKFGDGDGLTARFGFPAGMSVDPSGRVFVADRNVNRIRMIVQSDWDGDGIEDNAERNFANLTVGVDDSLADADGDGQPNAIEFLLGTDAADPNSRLVTGIDFSEGMATLKWPGLSGVTYVVEKSHDLAHWVPLPSGILDGEDGDLSWSDPEPWSARSFYRVVPLRP